MTLALGLAFAACSSSESDGTKLKTGSAGTTASGGSDGAAGTGAGAAGGAGGASGGGSGAVAGTSATGGSGGGAGSSGQGGSGGAGAAAGSGVTAGRGGSAGNSGSGSAEGGEAGAGAAGGSSGLAGSGGSAGVAGSGGSVTPQPGMNFFVTSKGMDTGGKLGGLEAADAFCKSLATAVSAELGAKTWHAYLSTTSVNARERIGTGPWRNQAGVVIANNLTDLHAQDAGEALDDTWPPTDLSIALDETGAELDNSIHDILTGSNADGTYSTGAACDDWTSDSEDDTAGVGHSNRDGGGRPPSFNATHTVGCAPFTSNYQDGTVSSGGGRGSLYCFALEPSPEP
jgi:hypothetical protein